MAVTSVSMALDISPAAASDTARAIAELLTVRLRPMISSNSCSLICGTGTCSGKVAGGPAFGFGGPGGHGPRCALLSICGG